MRKFRHFLLTTAVVLCSTLTTWAEDFDFSAVCSSGQTLYYTITSSTEPYTVQVTYPNYYGYYTGSYIKYYYYWNYTEPSGDLVIPETVTYNGRTYSVTSLQANAFRGCYELTSVTIPEGVTSIGGSAFKECSGLTSITIPEGVTTIGTSAFYQCSSLTSVEIPESVTSIGNEAFSYCNGLTAFVFLKATPPEFGTNVFYLTNYCPIYVPESAVEAYKSATNMSSYAGRVKKLTEITKGGVRYELQTDGTWAVVEIISSGDIIIPETIIGNSVTSVGTAFKNHSDITSVTIPNSVTSIEEGAFKGCSGLKSITLPFVGGKQYQPSDELQYPLGYIFGGSSYEGGTKVTQLYTPNNTSWGLNYYIPSSLESVTITGSYISYGAFSYCTMLTSVSISNTVENIGRQSFIGCKGLSSVTIPESVKSIGTYAFKDCTKLSTVRFNAINCTSAESAFNNCTSFYYLTIGKNVTMIPTSMFYSCKLVSVTFPESVKKIGASAFYDCKSLRSVTFNGEEPPMFGTSVFDNTNNCPIYVPTQAAVTKYKGATNMSSYASRVQCPTRTITVAANNNFGTVSGGGVYNINTTPTVTITAEPAENCIFVRWEDDGEGYTNATRTITITNDATYTAIFKRVLTVRATANNRTYNGATTATGTLVAEGVAEGDNVTLSYTAATFADKNVGTGKTVTFSGITLGGTNAGNYTLNDVTTTTATADITPKTISASATANSRAYNGTVAATGTVVPVGVMGTENVTLSYTTAAFADKNVGTGKTVTYSGITIGGTDAANYTLSSTTVTANANITAKGLTLSNFVAGEKTFDGTTNATGGSFSDDRVSGDALEFSFDYAFANMNAADAVTVNFRNIAISGGNDKDNYTLLTTSGTGSAKILPVTDEVAITITLADKSVVYSGAEQTYNAADALTIEADNALYNLDWVSESGNAASVSGTNAGEYAFGWNAEMFSNSSANFTNVTFNVTDGKLIITPNTNVVVTITENSKETAYNTEEQSVSGYTITNIEDETGKFAETDITFNGNAVAAGTTVGTYPMELSAADFSNKNTNFANVTFNIVDGALTITKAPVAPNKPETEMSTLFVNTQLIELPTDWAWTEFKALEEGANTATAEYKGADAGNYEIESVEIAITRNHCDHNGSTAMLYVVEATCTEQGYSGNLSCALCGEIYEYGHATDALGHDFENTIIAPTCTAEGYTEHLCKRCQHIEYSDTVAATGHKADSVVFENIVAATCTVAGSKDSVVYCSVCKTELSRTKVEIPATGHTIEVDAAVAATATETGLTEGSHCSVCHETIVAQEVIPALGEQGGNENQGGSGNENQGNENNNEPATVVSDEAVEAVNIYAYQNVIVVENATEEICIYNAMGALVCRDSARHVSTADGLGARTEIRMNNAGVYIVKVGNVVKRVMVY